MEYIFKSKFHWRTLGENLNKIKKHTQLIYKNSGILLWIDTILALTFYDVCEHLFVIIMKLSIFKFLKIKIVSIFADTSQ